MSLGGDTYIHTYGHRDSMTELAQWADSVKIERPASPSPNICIARNRVMIILCVVSVSEVGYEVPRISKTCSCSNFS